MAADENPTTGLDSETLRPLVNRVEVIDSTGRVFAEYYAAGATVSIQDQGRTIKIFAGEPKSPFPDTTTSLAALRAQLAAAEAERDERAAAFENAAAVANAEKLARLDVEAQLVTLIPP